MSPNEMLNNPEFINHSMELVFKWLFVIGAVLYMLFTLVVIRQISLMKKTLITEVSPLISTLGVAHFLMAACLVGFYLLFLWVQFLLTAASDRSRKIVLMGSCFSAFWHKKRALSSGLDLSSQYLAV